MCRVPAHEECSPQGGGACARLPASHGAHVPDNSYEARYTRNHGPAGMTIEKERAGMCTQEENTAQASNRAHHHLWDSHDD